MPRTGTTVAKLDSWNQRNAEENERYADHPSNGVYWEASPRGGYEFGGRATQGVKHPEKDILLNDQSKGWPLGWIDAWATYVATSGDDKEWGPIYAAIIESELREWREQGDVQHRL